jgi:hypothetical protein
LLLASELAMLASGLWYRTAHPFARTDELASANRDAQREVLERRKAEKVLGHDRLRFRSLVDATTAFVWSTGVR